MPLTPADVHNVAFKKPSIGKRGYDEDEVDAFLDVVEAELSRLIEENTELTERLDRVRGRRQPCTGRAAAPAAAPAELPPPAPAGSVAGNGPRPGGPAARARPGDRRPAHRGGQGRIGQVAGRCEEPVRCAWSSDATTPRRGRRTGQPDQGRGAGRRGQGPVRRGAGQAGRPSGSAWRRRSRTCGATSRSTAAG